MCFGCSKEPSHRDGSFEYPQHTFWLRNKENNFQLLTLIWGPAYSSDSVLDRVLDLRSRGHWLEAHWRHCLISLSKTSNYPQL